MVASKVLKIGSASKNGPIYLGKALCVSLRTSLPNALPWTVVTVVPCPRAGPLPSSIVILMRLCEGDPESPLDSRPVNSIGGTRP